jgi:hypothetical protein
VTHEAFAWAPFLALGCGVIAGLGVLHSVKRAFALAVTLWAIQVVAWMAVFVIAGAEQRDQPGDWNADLHGGYLVSLIVITPYTTIGAVVSGIAVGLLSPKGRRNRAGALWPLEHPSGNAHARWRSR